MVREARGGSGLGAERLGGAASAAGALFLSLAALAYDPSVSARTPKTVLLLALSAVALSLWLPGVVRRERASLTLPIVAWCSLLGWLATGLALHEHAVTWPLGSGVAVAALAVVLAGVPLEALRTLAGRTALLTALGTALAVASAWATGGMAHGGHGNPDWAGLSLVAALPLLVEHGLRARATERWVTAAVVVMAGVGLVLAGSRSAWVGGMVAALLVTRGRSRGVVAVLALVASVVVVWSTDVGRALTGRLWIWRHALVAGLREPWTGAGVGRFGFAFLEVQGETLGDMPLEASAVAFVNAQTAHHDGLQLLVEGGVPALALGALALGVAAWQLRARWRGGAAAAIAVGVAGLGDVALLQPGVLVALVFVFAACPRLAPRRLDGALAAVLLAMVAVLLPLAGSQWLAARAATAARGAALHERVVLLEQAVLLAPDDGVLALELGMALLGAGDAEAAVSWLERSSLTHANVGTFVALGNAHLAALDADAAVTAYERALALQPARFAAHTNLVEAARRAGRLELAERHLLAAAELLPHDPKLAVIRERVRRDRIEAATARELDAAADTATDAGPSD